MFDVKSIVCYGVFKCLLSKIVCLFQRFTVQLRCCSLVRSVLFVECRVVFVFVSRSLRSGQGRKSFLFDVKSIICYGVFQCLRPEIGSFCPSFSVFRRGSANRFRILQKSAEAFVAKRKKRKALEKAIAD